MSQPYLSYVSRHKKNDSIIDNQCIVDYDGS